MDADKTFTLRHHRCPGDLGRIVALHGELYAREYGFGVQFEAYAAETMAEFGKPERAGCDRLWVAEIDGQIVGSIGIIERDGNAAQLRCLLITPEARGMGLGAASSSARSPSAARVATSRFSCGRSRASRRRPIFMPQRDS